MGVETRKAAGGATGQWDPEIVAFERDSLRRKATEFLSLWPSDLAVLDRLPPALSRTRDWHNSARRITGLQARTGWTPA